MKKKLQSIANHLLDLGKRNRLLNFKEAGLKSVNILNRNYDEIFDNITNSKTYSFLMIDSVLKKYHNDLITNPEDDDVLNYSDLKVYDLCSKLLKNNQLLAYNRGYSLDKSLKALLKEYKYSITEKGINCLYISFGFLSYKEDNADFLAPIVLIPVEYTYEKESFKIKEYDDEIIVNPTLRYYLKTVKKIDLPEYLEDQKVSEYLESVKSVLLSDMSVKDGMAIGVYSFLKMNMYSDLTTNIDTVLENKNIRALLGEVQKPTPDENNQVYPVVNCDSSQLEAIKFAASGKSFVLQGPPGSGKSQTITNIISTLIGNGKHVLFVSEKLAALNVVYENLRRAGLSEFAIEIHSNKANKKEFIDNLYKTAILPKYDVSSKSELDYSKYENAKSDIENYKSELHKKLDCGYSLFELISMYYEINSEPIQYRLKDTGSFEDMENIYKELDVYANYAANLGADYRKLVFYGLKNIDNAYIRYEMSNDFKNAITYGNKLVILRNKINEYLGFKIKSIKDVYDSIECFSKLTHLNTYLPIYGNKEERNKLEELLARYLELESKLTNPIMDNYDKSIMKVSISKLYNGMVSHKGLFKVFNDEYNTSKQTALSYRRFKVKNKVLLKELKELVEYQRVLVEATKLNKEIKAISEFKNYHNVYKDLVALHNVVSFNLSSEQYSEAKTFFTDTMISFDTMKNDDLYIQKLVKIFDCDAFDIYKEDIDLVLDKLKGIILKSDCIGEYTLLIQSVDNITKYKALDYLHGYLESGYPINELAKQYRKIFVLDKLLNVIKASPIFASFTSYGEDKNVEDFKKLDEKILQINRDIAIAINSKKRPDDVLIEGSKFKILAKEAAKVRKQKPIRDLLDSIFELAVSIKPVFLMSPLSVSTYLNSENNLFDCVIFDEASQIFSWDALGAIYRSKQCIIIGDNKQMPPSNFFGAVNDEDDEEEELDSILDSASVCFLSSALKWHYRSRSEELITFSNREFYDNSLITIPQAKNHEVGFGVDLYFVDKGRYEMKTRTNRVEAERICDMVFEHFDKSKQSLGVVAFSNAQASLIESLIEKRLSANPKYQEFFDDKVDEPFFVKNLETVQGDERDRIIFSICYGYNNEGKFFQRFGPLNNVGGERRLNVAITRAKYNISVVSSIKYSDIKYENTESKGVKLLHDYLEFAENVSVNKNFIETDNGVMLSIKTYIESLGYEVYPNYGTSQFKIDLAVKKDNEFVMAIELDNLNTYKANTTDKERLQELLLNRLGWKYYRVYSIAWFTNEDLEKKKLEEALLSSRNVKTKEERVVSYLEENKEAKTLESNFIEYKRVDIDECRALLKKSSLNAVVTQIVTTEGPIHEDLLFKRVAEVLESGRVTNAIKNMVKGAMDPDIQYSNQFYYIGTNMSQLRIHSERDFDHISPEEIKDGIYTIVKQNNGITIDGCYKALVGLLGYSRITDNTRRKLDDAVVFLKLDGLVIQRGESLFI